MDHLQTILASDAFQNPAHPMHGRLMDAIASWRDTNWQALPEDARANLLPQIARSDAYRDPANKWHGPLLRKIAGLSQSLELMRSKGALDPAVDPETANVRELLTSYAAREEKHPMHAAVRARIDQHYEAQAGGIAPAI